MSDEADQPDAKKRDYKKPTVKVYGQVKDLTGSNIGSMGGDAATMMLP